MACCRLRKTLTFVHSLLFSMLHESTVSQDASCPLPEAILIDSTCFIYTASNVTWHEAKILCEEKETLLAKVLGADHVRKILSNYSGKISTAGAAFGAWVGANDLRREGSFHWLDDDASVVENVWAAFEPNQPSNVEEDCAAINRLMLLAAVDCGIRNSYLCMHEDQQEDFELDFPEHNWKCEHLVKTIVDRMTVDLHCYSGPTEVNSLSISWRGFKTICSIYFNGGRNLIFLNSTYQITPGPDPNKGDYYPVDGSKARGGLCTQARVGAGPKNYIVKLGNPLLIREIILYRRVTCPEGKYGLLCDNNCMDKCNSSKCLDNGGCFDIPIISTTRSGIKSPMMKTSSTSISTSATPTGVETKITSKSVSAIDIRPPIGLTVFVNATDSPAGSGSENSLPEVTTVLNLVTNTEDKNTTRHPINSTVPPHRFQDYKKKLLYLAWSLLAVGVLCSLCVTVLCCVHRREVKQEVKAESMDLDLDFDFDDDEASKYLEASYSRSTSTSKYGGKSLSYSLGPSLTGSTMGTSGTSHSYSTILAK